MNHVDINATKSFSSEHRRGPNVRLSVKKATHTCVRKIACPNLSLEACLSVPQGRIVTKVGKI